MSRRSLASLLVAACVASGIACGNDSKGVPADAASDGEQGSDAANEQGKPPTLPDGAPAGDAGAEPAAEGGPDVAADVAADALPDAVADLPADPAAEKAPDIAADPPVVDPPVDAPVDPPPDLPVDPPPVDLPVDLPVDPPVDSPAGTPPSCAGLPPTCGPSGTESCCASGLVPGGTYNRSNDPMYPATVSDFRLDRYEITVGRFRKFVEAGMGTMSSAPAAGSGENPSNPVGTGWDAAWNASLPASTAALKAAVKCGAPYHNWTDGPGGNENRPMNCIDWYEAFAFCIWDGGRLASEAEWNYAAAGGDEQRQYPWSVPPSSTIIDCTYANYYGAAGPTYCSATGTNNVGSESPKGDSKWGQADLAGNLWEWSFDWYGTYIKPCINCANTTGASNRVVRGGGFITGELALFSSFRTFLLVPTSRRYDFGSRCARTP